MSVCSGTQVYTHIMPISKRILSGLNLKSASKIKAKTTNTRRVKRRDKINERVGTEVGWEIINQNKESYCK